MSGGGSIGGGNGLTLGGGMVGDSWDLYNNFVNRWCNNLCGNREGCCNAANYCATNHSLYDENYADEEDAEDCMKIEKGY